MFYELIYIGGMEYNFVMKMDYEELAISHQALVNIKGDQGFKEVKHEFKRFIYRRRL